MAGGSGRGNGGSVGRTVENSTRGGNIVLGGSFPGMIVGESGGLVVSASGKTVTGISVARALQCSVGLPVVPGGQVQRGL